MIVSHRAGEGASLPDGFRVRLRSDIIKADQGKILVGGSPLRLVRLGATARELLTNGEVTVDGPITGALARHLLNANLAEPVLDHVDVPSSELTVVIPIRDRAEQLHRCLRALASLKIIVVDDASRDRAAVAEVARRHGATLVTLPTNRGPAWARNIGLSHVDTPLVAFVDSDVEITAGALLRLARHCVDPALALVGPRVVGVVRSEQPRWFEKYDAVASSLDLGRTGGQVRPGAEIGWLPSACLVGRADLLGDGFRKTWRVAEDVDFVWRLLNTGHVVRYDPTIEAQHDVRSSVLAWLGRKFLYGTGGADLAAQHGDKVAPAILSVPMALGAAAVLQLRWWSIPVATLVVATTAWSLRTRLSGSTDRTVVALRLATRGLGWAVRQESALLLRHWWPAAAIAATLSRSVRRTIAVAAAVDLARLLWQRSTSNLLTAFLGNRLDDLAYGAGLWWGAIHRRDMRCLHIRWVARSGNRRIRRR